MGGQHTAGLVPGNPPGRRSLSGPVITTGMANTHRDALLTLIWSCLSIPAVAGLTATLVHHVTRIEPTGLLAWATTITPWAASLACTVIAVLHLVPKLAAG